MMALEFQWHGMNRGFQIGFQGEHMAGYSLVPRAESAFEVINAVLTVCFSIELVLRVGAAYFQWEELQLSTAVWILLDAVIIGLNIVAEIFSGFIVVRPNLLRLLRFARIARLVRLMQHMTMFQSLLILVRSLQVSVGALFWSFILLFLVQCLVGLILCHSLVDFISDEANDEKVRQEVFSHFGTFSRAMVTMFEITLANWAPTCHLLVDNVSETYAIFYILYRCTFVFAIVRVISAVFIAETNRMMADDDELEAQKKDRLKKKYIAKLEKLFLICSNDSGKQYLMWEDFERNLEDETISLWLSTMDIDATDLKAMFEILDEIDHENEPGVIEHNDFVQGLMLMKGQARALDVLYLRKQMNDLVNKCDDIAACQNQKKPSPLVPVMDVKRPDLLTSPSKDQTTSPIKAAL